MTDIAKYVLGKSRATSMLFLCVVWWINLCGWFLGGTFRPRTDETDGIGLGKAQYIYALPEGQRLRDLQANQDCKDPMQKTHWHSRTSSRKNW